MSQREKTPNPRIVWPRYFQPRPGQESPPTGELLRIPANLIDVFYLRSSERESTNLICVVGCLGGGIDVVHGEHINDLPHTIQSQLQTVQVSRRNRFRAITASELHVFSLDATEQQARSEGFNDAVYLYGKMHEKLTTNLGGVQSVDLSNEGTLKVGRLDLLHALRQSPESSFHNPDTPDETMYHLLVPAASVLEVENGQGLTFVYPILDPKEFKRTDNSVIVKRIAYDILSKLQQDMLKQGSQHPFTKQVIPVPSLFRLEVDLANDGYEIKGKSIKSFQQSQQVKITE
jgi:hypothetical protein